MNVKTLEFDSHIYKMNPRIHYVHTGLFGKIWAGLIEKKVCNLDQMDDYTHRMLTRTTRWDEFRMGGVPKIHHVVENGDFKKGDKIQMYTKDTWGGNKRDYVKMAPEVTCTAVQDVEIKLIKDEDDILRDIEITVDGACLDRMYRYGFMWNEGYFHKDDFAESIGNKNIKGQVVHWTDMLYTDLTREDISRLIENGFEVIGYNDLRAEVGRYYLIADYMFRTLRIIDIDSGTHETIKNLGLFRTVDDIISAREKYKSSFPNPWESYEENLTYEIQNKSIINK